MTSATNEPQRNSRAEAVVIGASAGAIEALSAILPMLSRDYPLPVMVVVHLPPDKTSIMAELFSTKCRVSVREAEDKEPLVGGTVYFAPPDYHLLVEPSRILSLSSEEVVHYSRPAIDPLFESAADVFGAGLVGVILTGASEDGAHGLQSVFAAGGTAIVQHPDRAHVATMPRAALAACPAARQMQLIEIAEYLVNLGRQP